MRSFKGAVRLFTAAAAAIAIGERIAWGQIGTVGEVLVLQTEAETVASVGGTWRLVSLPVIARRVIEHAGDHFQTINIWSTVATTSEYGSTIRICLLVIDLHRSLPRMDAAASLLSGPPLARIRPSHFL